MDKTLVIGTRMKYAVCMSCILTVFAVIGLMNAESVLNRVAQFLVMILQNKFASYPDYNAIESAPYDDTITYTMEQQQQIFDFDCFWPATSARFAKFQVVLCIYFWLFFAIIGPVISWEILYHVIWKNIFIEVFQ
ncbi:hypothetical protein KGF57_003167 [Candida theae]|uniref:Uncharacterized protein n=1 Tax=Candida theae TaxID=1198502 RepID=A0AAD5FY58_9ASCO|nr:uncharacterized protein KGF57_003167 [Candida theae]KAI5957473.1 hypothetical protein KGF57_003167 [Candida theae]